MSLPVNSNSSTTSGSLRSSHLNEKIFLGLFSTVAVMIVISNGAFIILLTKKKSLQTPSNILLGALSLSDLLVGLVVLPLWITEFSYIISGEHSVRVVTIFLIKHSVTWYCVLLSLSFIVCSSLDRYIAICYPFQYSAKATSKTHLKLTVICFIASICIFGLLAAANFSSFDVSRSTFTFLTGSALATTAFCNVRIFIILRKLSKTTQSTSLSWNVDRLTARRDIERKKAVLIGVITAIFFLCFSPFIIRICLEITGVLDNISQNSAKQSKLWTQFLAISNSLVNPIVYYARMAKFRKAAHEVFCSRLPVVRVNPRSSSLSM